MNRHHAKQILISHRPGIDDDSDPEIREALLLAEVDPELKAWFESQLSSHAAIRACFHRISVPPDLRERILADRKVVAPLWRRREFLAAAAAAVLLLALSAFWFRPSKEDETFAAFRSRMVRFVRREYRMDIVTNDPAQVRQFLAKGGAPAEYALPRGLESRPVLGGAKLSWQGHPVSMVCFSAPTKDILYLFVLDRAAVRDGAVPESAPAIVQLHRLNAAGWSRGNQIYLLAGPIAEAELRSLW